MKQKIVIGSRYQETKTRLVKEIQASTISILEMIATNHACYFCVRKIDGQMYQLTYPDKSNESKAEERFFLDKKCYDHCIQEMRYN